MGRKLFALAGIACFVLAAAGCSSGSSSKPTPAAQPTIALPTVASTAELQPYTSHIIPYTLSVPASWTQKDGNFGGDVFYFGAQDSFDPQLKVTCAATGGGKVDVASMLQQDQTGVSHSTVPATAFVITDIKAGDLAGSKAVYSVNAGSVRVRNVVAYFGGERCGWRIQLSVFTRAQDTNDPAQYDGLFDKVVATFVSHESDVKG